LAKVLVSTCSRRESQLGFKAYLLCKPKTTNTTSRGTRLATLMAAHPNSILLLSTTQLLGCLDLVKMKMTKVIKTSKTLADLIQKTTSAVVIHHVSPSNSQSNVLASTMLLVTLTGCITSGSASLWLYCNSSELSKRNRHLM
jgi:hypothetical protein